jgi:hypothetical protein
LPACGDTEVKNPTSRKEREKWGTRAVYSCDRDWSIYGVRGDRVISADTAIRLGKYFGLRAQFWLNLQNDYDLRIAEGSGIGREIKRRNVGDHPQLTGMR